MALSSSLDSMASCYNIDMSSFMFRLKDTSKYKLTIRNCQRNVSTDVFKCEMFNCYLNAILQL